MIVALDAPCVDAADEKLHRMLTPRLANKAPEQNKVKSFTGCPKNNDMTEKVSPAIMTRKNRLNMILLMINSLGFR